MFAVPWRQFAMVDFSQWTLADKWLIMEDIIYIVVLALAHKISYYPLLTYFMYILIRMVKPNYSKPSFLKLLTLYVWTRIIFCPKDIGPLIPLLKIFWEICCEFAVKAIFTTTVTILLYNIIRRNNGRNLNILLNWIINFHTY